jgi:hypothetical protein
MSFVDILNQAQNAYFINLESQLRSVFDTVCGRTGLNFVNFSKTRSMMGGSLLYEGETGQVYIYAYPTNGFRRNVVEIDRYSRNGKRFGPSICTDNITEAQKAIREMRGTDASNKKNQ